MVVLHMDIRGGGKGVDWWGGDEVGEGAAAEGADLATRYLPLLLHVTE